MNKLKKLAHDLAMAAIDWQMGRDIRRLMDMKLNASTLDERIAAYNEEVRLEDKLAGIHEWASRRRVDLRIAKRVA